MPEQLHQPENIQELVSVIQESAELAQFRANFTYPEAIVEFARQAEFFSFDQGDLVFRQGDKGQAFKPGTNNGFVVVMQGQLRAIDPPRDTSQRPQLLSYFTQGEIVGERAMLSNTVRTATVEVVTHYGKLAFFTHKSWDWLMQHNPEFASHFTELEASRLKQSRVVFPENSRMKWLLILLNGTFWLSLLPSPSP
jgi:CRP-like cAMP-binding protein